MCLMNLVENENVNETTIPSDSISILELERSVDWIGSDHQLIRQLHDRR